MSSYMPRAISSAILALCGGLLSITSAVAQCNPVEFSSVQQAVGDGSGVVVSQVSATEFDVYLRATDPATCGSPAAFVSDPNKPLTGSISFGYAKPTSGTRVLSQQSAPAGAVGVAGVGVTPINLSATNGVADQPLRFKYTDVGALVLSVQLDVPGLASNSPEIIFAPSSIVFGPITDPNGLLSDPTVADANSPRVFVQAGQSFSVEVTVQNAEGGSVPNFGREWGANNGERLIVRSTLLSPSPLASPAGENGVNGHLGNGVMVNGIAFNRVGNGSTFLNTELAFGEVGVIQLEAAIAPETNEANDNSDALNDVGVGQYLNAVPSPVAVSAAVGRFVPATFAVDIAPVRFNSGCMLDDTNALALNTGGFTYRGQWLSFELGPTGAPIPTATITAMSAPINGTPIVTTNYSGDYFKVTRRTLADRVYVDSDPDVTLVPSNLDVPDPLDVTETIMADVTVEADPDNRGEGKIQFQLDPQPNSAGDARLLSYEAADTAPIDANISLSFVLSDADGVESANGGVVVIDGPVAGDGIPFTGDRSIGPAGAAVVVTGREIRSGRLNINNAYGPTTTLSNGEPNSLTPLPFIAEYFDGTRWAINDWDHCTMIDRSAIERSNMANSFVPMTRFVPDADATPPITATQNVAPLRAGDAKLQSFSSVVGSAPVEYNFLMPVPVQNISYLERTDNPSLISALITHGTYIGDPRIRQISYRNSIIYK